MSSYSVAEVSTRESNRRLLLNFQCNRLLLHFIFGQFNRLRLLKKIVTDHDYDYPVLRSWARDLSRATFHCFLSRSLIS